MAPFSPDELCRQLQQCRTLISLLAEKVDELEKRILSTSPDSEVDKKDSLSTSQNSERIKDAYFTTSQNNEVDKEPYLSTSQNSKVVKEQFLSTSQNTQVDKEGFLSTSQNSDGYKPEITTTNGILSGQDLYLLSTRISPDALYTVLHNGDLKGIKRRTIRSIVAVLMHIIHQPAGNSLASFGAMLKLSKGGIAKFMAMLLRRGLVVRTAYQTYALTAKAIGYMQAAAMERKSV